MLGEREGLSKLCWTKYLLWNQCGSMHQGNSHVLAGFQYFFLNHWLIYPGCRQSLTACVTLRNTNLSIVYLNEFHYKTLCFCELSYRLLWWKKTKQMAIWYDEEKGKSPVDRGFLLLLLSENPVFLFHILVHTCES